MKGEFNRLKLKTFYKANIQKCVWRRDVTKT